MTIKERLDKIRFFKVEPDFSVLNTRERGALRHCLIASRAMTDIYLGQIAHDNLEVMRLLSSRSDQEGVDLYNYFKIHGCPWDGYNHEEPFVPGVCERPKFGSFYPAGLTKDEWDAWLKSHSEDRPVFESNYTVIKRLGDRLVAIPYSAEYATHLREAAHQLRLAAYFLPEGPLRSFLMLRANAFESNDYFQSDMAWVDTNGIPFEVTIGPYEVYFDQLLGLKASFESFLALPDLEATQALSRFSPHVPDFDAILGEEFGYTPSNIVMPLEVVTDVFRGGEAGFGYMFVAYNLPNDRRVHEARGSKKVFSRTMMEAIFNTIALPIAARILPTSVADRCTFANRLNFVVGHELAHGLGPKRTVQGATFNQALKDLHSTIEEAKADMLGVRMLVHFLNQNLIDDETILGAVLSVVVSFFQGWKHGFTEAHAKGDLIEYNWIKAFGGLRYDVAVRKYEIDLARCVNAMINLSAEFIKLQAEGDYDRAKAFVEHWGAIPKEVPEIIESLSDIPTSVHPIYLLSSL